MRNQFYKYYFLLLFSLTYSNKILAQEKLNVFTVVDSITKKPIPSASIVVMRAKLAISTEKDGIFIIPGNLKKMRDTVIVSAQSYSSCAMLIDKMEGLDSIKLTKFVKPVVLAKLDDKNTKSLNVFNRKEVVHYAGLHTETSTFEYLELAQQFYITKPIAILKKLSINRLAFNLHGEYQNSIVGMEVTKFGIRIYDADTIKGGPGREISDRLIQINNKDNRILTINLENHNILITGKSFFVAIEWMRDFTNQGFDMVFQKKTMSYIKLVNFRPAIGISPIKGDKLNIWGLNMKRQWKPYTYFSPDYTDLAIIATVAQ